jgi:hypothetical protein
MAKGLTIEVPEDDEEIEAKQPNTTPSSKTKEAGFFRYGKNSPTAVDYKSLKSRALDLASRLSQKATQSNSGTPKSMAASNKLRSTASRKLHPNLIKVKVKQSTTPKTEKFTPKVFDFSTTGTTKSLKSLTPQNKELKKRTPVNYIFKSKESPFGSSKARRPKTR